MPDQRSDRDAAHTLAEITALIGSRICHDLISPLGAIGNGVELLGMAGDGLGPELELIAESVSTANAKIKFFRVAFGTASADQRIGRPEIIQTLDEYTKSNRQKVSWQVEGDQSRGEVKMAFLAIQCLETALPYGGTIEVQLIDRIWSVTGAAPKFKIDPDLWRALEAQTPLSAEVGASQVQFALLPAEALHRKRIIETEFTDAQVTIRF